MDDLEWVDPKYACDNCGEDSPGKYYDIHMRGWRPLCICERCLEETAVWNEE